ncbi:MAG: DUF3181 family protein [Leptolyngbyaceae cyanobacterium SL_5_9]|nr:DUF3181 family protein [Leptolyngbyaceae cyanobacterium SL_5_9]NJO74407.1 DUF3181 family protein [Leptolyngbyaceae cyanobacterium RM1_406_9]
MAQSGTTEAIESLAAEIGENIYIDVAKWHLYLRDAHLHTLLAERFYPMLTDSSIDQSKVAETLSNIPVKLGGGKREVPLSDLLPAPVQSDLVELLEEYQRKL